MFTCLIRERGISSRIPELYWEYYLTKRASCGKHWVGEYYAIALNSQKAWPLININFREASFIEVWLDLDWNTRVIEKLQTKNRFGDFEFRNTSEGFGIKMSAYKFTEFLGLKNKEQQYSFLRQLYIEINENIIGEVLHELDQEQKRQ